MGCCKNESGVEGGEVDGVDSFWWYRLAYSEGESGVGLMRLSFS